MTTVAMPYAESFGVITTVDNTWTDTASIPAGSFTAGRKYLIVANAIIQCEGGAAEHHIRLVRGTTPTVFTDAEAIYDPGIVGATGRATYQYVTVFTQPDPAELVKLQILREASTADVTAELAQIQCIDITDLVENTDYWWNEVTADYSTTTTPTAQAAVTFTPNGSDNFLVLGNVSQGPPASVVDGNDFRAYLHESVGATTTPLIDAETEDADAGDEARVWGLMRSWPALSAVSHTFSVRPYHAGAVFNVTSSRIFALRLNAFAQHAITHTTAADAPAATPSWETEATVSLTPAVTGEYFILAAASLAVVATTTRTAARLQHDNSGSLVSNPAYGDNEPGNPAWDATDTIPVFLGSVESLTSGASRTVNFDWQHTVGTTATVADRSLVMISAELAAVASAAPVEADDFAAMWDAVAADGRFAAASGAFAARLAASQDEAIPVDGGPMPVEASVLDVDEGAGAAIFDLAEYRERQRHQLPPPEDESIPVDGGPMPVEAVPLDDDASPSLWVTQRVPDHRPAPEDEQLPVSGWTNSAFPLRGAFYYGWFTGGGDPNFPGAWNQLAIAPYTQFQPKLHTVGPLAYYDSGAAATIDNHIAALAYGRFDTVILSWWGQGSREDLLVDEFLEGLVRNGSNIKVTLYYEAEGNVIAGVAGSPDPTSAQIASDLDYISAKYSGHQNFLHIGGKPVIFAYGGPEDGTQAAADRPTKRWADALLLARESWYDVLKVYAGYNGEPDQPSSWHQYGPASAYDQQGALSVTISPGYWFATTATPLLERDVIRWAQDVTRHLAAGTNWQLVTSFNEWGEGHGVENVDDNSGRNYTGHGWDSASGFGQYLDILNANGQGWHTVPEFEVEATLSQPPDPAHAYAARLPAEFEVLPVDGGPMPAEGPPGDFATAELEAALSQPPDPSHAFAARHAAIEDEVLPVDGGPMPVEASVLEDDGEARAVLSSSPPDPAQDFAARLAALEDESRVPGSGLAITAWRFYENDAVDPTSPLAAENTIAPLTGAHMQNGRVRLRLQLRDLGGAALATGALSLQYSTDGLEWVPLEPSSGSTTPEAVVNGDEGTWFRYGQGLGTDGVAVGSLLLTGSTVAGAHHESRAGTETHAAGSVAELDFPLFIHWPPPDVSVYFRVVDAGTPIVAATPPALAMATAAQRPYSVVYTDPDTGQKVGRELRYAAHRRVFFDPIGRRWWYFTQQFGTNTVVRSYYYDGGSAAWTAGATYTSAAAGASGTHTFTFAVISGVPVVWAHTGSSTSTRRYNRGTISGTTLTWGTEESLSQASQRSRHIAFDDSNRIWLLGLQDPSGTGIWARRATNADTGSAWTTGWDAAITLADTGAVTGNLIAGVGISSTELLVVWFNGTKLRWSVVTAGGAFTAAQDVDASANNPPEDWGLVRAGGYVFLVTTDATGAGGNHILRIFDIASRPGATWTLGTSPSVSGAPSSDDGIAVVEARPGELWHFWTDLEAEGGQSREVRYKKYRYGPGAESSGTWSGPYLYPGAGPRGNSDHITANVGGGAVMLLSLFGDDSQGAVENRATGFVVEFFPIDVADPQVDDGAELAALSRPEHPAHAFAALLAATEDEAIPVDGAPLPPGDAPPVEEATLEYEAALSQPPDPAHAFAARLAAREDEVLPVDGGPMPFDGPPGDFATAELEIALSQPPDPAHAFAALLAAREDEVLPVEGSDAPPVEEATADPALFVTAPDPAHAYAARLPAEFEVLPVEGAGDPPPVEEATIAGALLVVAPNVGAQHAHAVAVHDSETIPVDGTVIITVTLTVSVALDGDVPGQSLDGQRGVIIGLDGDVPHTMLEGP